jgi:flagellar motility protein MotE (MotC chaperone)
MMKRGSLIGVICIFSALVVAKVLLSGLYLSSGPLKIGGVKLALAGENEASPSVKVTMPPQFREKERELKAREEQIQKKESELLPLREEIETKMAELSDLQARLTALAKELAEKERAMEDSKMNHLVSLYSAMEPARAAAIMDKLKLQTVVLILRHMKGKSAGQILAMMNPEKGAVISEELTRMD